MELDKIDIIKFYILYRHYNPISNNIGIIGDTNRFKNYIKDILKALRKSRCRVISNEDKTKYTIIKDNIEYTYALIRNTDDLKGLYFKKFI